RRIHGARRQNRAWEFDGREGFRPPRRLCEWTNLSVRALDKGERSQRGRRGRADAAVSHPVEILLLCLSSKAREPEALPHHLRPAGEGDIHRAPAPAAKV